MPANSVAIGTIAGMARSYKINVTNHY